MVSDLEKRFKKSLTINRDVRSAGMACSGVTYDEKTLLSVYF